jgi:3-hydroxyacyl-CoA dehydrogenase
MNSEPKSKSFPTNKSNAPNSDEPCDTTKLCVVLAGAGVVGRAILVEHLRAGIETLLVDINESAVELAVRYAVAEAPNVQAIACASPITGLAAVRFTTSGTASLPPNLLIESISENLELKQQFFATARQSLGPSCVLATNTSNLSVRDIFATLPGDTHSLGLHFFMPVGQRPLIEIIGRSETSDQAITLCQRLAGQLNKQLLSTADTPGFVVNRLLAPYLNQSLLLLGRGAAPENVAAAATRFGMPLSPLALIDLIGIRTAFDSGRVFWRHFPKRIDPAPILSGMIKAKRLGKDFGGGFYGDDETIHPNALSVIERYFRDQMHWKDDDLLECLTIPMWIEAAEVLAAGVVESFEDVEIAMRGGLGYRNQNGFFGFFDALGRKRIMRRIEASAGQPALTLNPALIDALADCLSPSDAIARYAKRTDRPSSINPSSQPAISEV